MMRTATRGLAAILMLATLSVVPTVSKATIGHRAIKAKPVATGLNGPSGFTFAPSGVIWYLERGTGEVHTLDPKTGKNHRVFTISGVNGAGERGALGIALSPRWPAKKVVYVYVTRNGNGHLQNQLFVSRRPAGPATGSGCCSQARRPQTRTTMGAGSCSARTASSTS